MVAVLFLALFAAAQGTTWHREKLRSVEPSRTATGAVIAGATVKVKNLETGAIRTLVTDSRGPIRRGLAGRRKIQVTAEQSRISHESRKQESRSCSASEPKWTSSSAVGGVQQNVQVEETALQLAVTTAEFSGLVGEQQVKDLPLNGRSYDQLLTLNPGVVNYTSQRAGGIGTSNSVVGNMFSASGRRPQENLYILNGVEFTSASEINNTPGGTSGQLLGVDAVREFSVVTGRLRRRIRQAPRRPDQHRDRLRHESTSRQRLRIPAQQRAGRQKSFRPAARFRT